MNGAPLPGAHGDAVLRVVLSNGLTVLARRDASAPVVAIVTHVSAGYFDEPDDVVGISHVLEHMYFKGTPTYGPGDIARTTKAAGGYLNAGTIYDLTRYYAVVPSSGFATALAVQADAFANSLIDGGELARELEVIIEEEGRKRDNPSAVATEACFELLYDVHRMRRWRIGEPQALRGFTRDDVLRFYRTHYVPRNTVLCIVGDIDPELAVEEVQHRYGALNDSPHARHRGGAEPNHTGFRWRDLTRDVKHAHVVLGWRTVPPLHDDAPALDVAASLLGAGRASRLYREVRERSIASSVGAYHYAPTELGVFLVDAESPPERYADVARALYAQVRAAASDAPSTAEVARVQRGIEARWWRRLESMEGQAVYLANWEALGGWEHGATFFDRVLGVTPADVRNVAAKYLTLDQSALVTLRPESALTLAADLPGARAALSDERVPPVARREPNAAEPAALVGLGVTADRVVGRVSTYRTEGGTHVVVRRKAGAPVAYVEAVFLGGVADETNATAGRTTLLARTALQGTAHRDGPQLAEDIEALGGAIGSVVGTEAFGWTLSVPPAHLAAALTLLAEVVEVPALPDDALETERAIALAGLAQLRDDMSRQPGRLALAAAFGDHPYGRPVLGTEDGLRATTASMLRAWHERRVRAGHGLIAVVADAEPGELAAMIRGSFRALTHTPRTIDARTVWPLSAEESAEERDKAQTAISMLLPAPRRDDPRRRAADLASIVTSGLGGRFFQALRDRESLAYTVSVSARACPRAGWFSTYLACAPSKAAAARAGMLREWNRLATGGVTEDEMTRAKAYALGSLAIRQQSAASVLSDIVDAALFGTLEELDDEPRAIAALTAGDVDGVVRDYFDEQRAVWGMVIGKR